MDEGKISHYRLTKEELSKIITEEMERRGYRIVTPINIEITTKAKEAKLIDQGKLEFEFGGMTFSIKKI